MQQRSQWGIRGENEASINEVLERKCLFFWRLELEEIWGPRPNVKVIATETIPSSKTASKTALLTASPTAFQAASPTASPTLLIAVSILIPCRALFFSDIYIRGIFEAMYIPHDTIEVGDTEVYKQSTEG